MANEIAIFRQSRKRRPLEERFWDKVMPEPNSGCWLWIGAINKKMGYGVIQLGSRKNRTVLAHRLIYQIERGEIPNGLVIDHRCRVRCCVNPHHLRVVTHQVNILAGVGATAEHARRTHCVNGHAFDAENTIFVQGGRRCRTCVAVRKQRYHAEGKY